MLLLCELYKPWPSGCTGWSLPFVRLTHSHRRFLQTPKFVVWGAEDHDEVSRTVRSLLFFLSRLQVKVAAVNYRLLLARLCPETKAVLYACRSMPRTLQTPQPRRIKAVESMTNKSSEVYDRDSNSTSLMMASTSMLTGFLMVGNQRSQLNNWETIKQKIGRTSTCSFAIYIPGGGIRRIRAGGCYQPELTTN